MSTVAEFGRQLLKTGDLDPVYVAIHGAQLAAPLKARLCLAYWCFYSLGAAARMAEAKTDKAYWALMREAAANVGEPKPWPRGAERRHYRGAQAVDSMAELFAKYGSGGAQKAVEGFIGISVNTTYSRVAARVQTHRGFGEWIAFKIADMSERVLGYNTDFSDCHLGIYKDPRQGAAVAYLEAELFHPLADPKWEGKPWDFPITDHQLGFTVAHYVKVFRAGKFKAPPDFTRPVNVQEVETIFCKYKSHLKGHYPPGKDTLELHHSLAGWGDLAEQLRAQLPHAQDRLKGV